MISPSTARAQGFHPLEIIPFFRRWPCSPWRDLVYTFIWNGFFAVGFYLLSAMFSVGLPSFEVFRTQLVMANFIGYSIHALFWIGDVAGLDARVRGAGYMTKVIYYATVPLVGVGMGFVLAGTVLHPRFLEWFLNPGSLVSVLLTSLIISVVLSVIFFWRERSANAEAEAAKQSERAERIEREATLANLRALQAQIEPHFLFNTLANVASLVDTDPAMAKRMLESFNRFLRASLAATRRESTTLGEEAELIAAYLDVLQVRMGPRLRYRIEVPESLRAFALPPMLLQPLVENAIRHGLEPRIEGGEVALRAVPRPGEVAIEIVDTGVGFAPVTRGGGVGLANLRDRLKLLYAGRARFSIGENPPRGTRVDVVLPA